jgi:hypothetical protein
VVLCTWLQFDAGHEGVQLVFQAWFGSPFLIAPAARLGGSNEV